MSQTDLPTVAVFGVPVFDGTRGEVLGLVTGWLEGSRTRVVLTPTTEQIVMVGEEAGSRKQEAGKEIQNSKFKIQNEIRNKAGSTNTELREGEPGAGRREVGLLECFRAADLNVADAVGVVWAAQRAGAQQVERYAGVDLMQDLFTEALKRGKKVFLLGGGKGVAQKAAEALFGNVKGQSSNDKESSKLKAQSTILNSKSEIRNLSELVGWDSGSDDIARETEGEARRVIRKINSFGADLLLVAYGAPWQERWLTRHRDELDVKVAMGVGGAMDMWAGKVVRAPLKVRKIGLEWLWRLVHQPWRWKRQLRLLKFVGMVLGKVKFQMPNE